MKRRSLSIGPFFTQYTIHHKIYTRTRSFLNVICYFFGFPTFYFPRSIFRLPFASKEKLQNLNFLIIFHRRLIHGSSSSLEMSNFLYKLDGPRRIKINLLYGFGVGQAIDA